MLLKVSSFRFKSELVLRILSYCHNNAMNLVVKCFILCISLASCEKLYLIETADRLSKNTTQDQNTEGQDYSVHGNDYRYWNRPRNLAARLEYLKTEVDGMLDASIKAETKLKQDLVEIIDTNVYYA